MNEHDILYENQGPMTKTVILISCHRPTYRKVKSIYFMLHDQIIKTVFFIHF